MSTDVMQVLSSAQANCPRCGSFSTYCRRGIPAPWKVAKRAEVSAAAAASRRLVSLHYCKACKLAWMLKQEAETVQICANCDAAIVPGGSSFLCSTMCGRSFHVECVRDPMKDSLACKVCSEADPAPIVLPTEFTTQKRFSTDAIDVFRSLLNDDDLSEKRFPTFAGNWPQPCNMRSEPLGFAIEAQDKRRESDGTISMVSPLPGAVSLAELVPSIRRVWDDLLKESPDASSDFLDEVTEANLAQQGSYLIEQLLSKVLQVRSQSLTKKASVCGTWMHVLTAARATDVSEDLVSAACERLQVIYNSPEYSYEALCRFMGTCSMKDSSRNEEKAGTPRSSPGSKPGPVIESAEEVRKWTTVKVKQFLQSQLLMTDAVADTFVQNGVDGTTLLDLTYEDLKDDLELTNETDIAAILQRIVEIREASL